MHLVAFIIRIYHDARPPERQFFHDVIIQMLVSGLWRRVLFLIQENAFDLHSVGSPLTLATAVGG